MENNFGTCLAKRYLQAIYTISMIHLYTFVHKHALRCSCSMFFLNSTSLSQKMKTVEEKSGVVKQTCYFQNFKPTDRSKNQEEGAPNCRPTFHANNFSRISNCKLILFNCSLIRSNFHLYKSVQLQAVYVKLPPASAYLQPDSV